eukprot:scaffold2226_cov38-Prasinocladus_malaysianus.AAC.2
MHDPSRTCLATAANKYHQQNTDSTRGLRSAHKIQSIPDDHPRQETALVARISSLGLFGPMLRPYNTS